MNVREPEETRLKFLKRNKLNASAGYFGLELPFVISTQQKNYQYI